MNMHVACECEYELQNTLVKMSYFTIRSWKIWIMIIKQWKEIKYKETLLILIKLSLIEGLNISDYIAESNGEKRTNSR